MDEILTLNIDGIIFDCYWETEENDHGDSYFFLASVFVGDQDITEILSYEWFNKIEKVLVKQLEEEKSMGYDF